MGEDSKSNILNGSSIILWPYLSGATGGCIGGLIILFLNSVLAGKKKTGYIYNFSSITTKIEYIILSILLGSITGITNEIENALLWGLFCGLGWIFVFSSFLYAIKTIKDAANQKRKEEEVNGKRRGSRYQKPSFETCFIVFIFAIISSFFLPNKPDLNIILIFFHLMGIIILIWHKIKNPSFEAWALFVSIWACGEISTIIAIVQ